MGHACGMGDWPRAGIVVAMVGVKQSVQLQVADFIQAMLENGLSCAVVWVGDDEATGLLGTVGRRDVSGKLLAAMKELV